MSVVATLAHAQLALWGTRWSAATTTWGVGVCVWSLIAWTAPAPLPLVAATLGGVLVVLPLVHLALGHLAAHEPTGPRGRAWMVWCLAAVCLRPPVRTLFAVLDLLAQVGAPLLLAVALVNLHPALVLFAVVPLLWRARLVRLLAERGS